MRIELVSGVRVLEGFEEAIAAQTPSRGDVLVRIKLIGLRRHLSRTLVVVIVKSRSEGVGAAAEAPS